MLDAQYAGGKVALRPVYEAVVSAARALGDDVTTVVQKTGVSLRGRKHFGLIQAPSAKSLNDPSDLDREAVAWLRAAYDRAR